MNEQKEVYLGDGLYARDDGYHILLRAPREDGDHWVGMESEVLMSFIRYLERARKVKISIKRIEEEEGQENG
jgi:hypothetical protein